MLLTVLKKLNQFFSFFISILVPPISFFLTVKFPITISIFGIRDYAALSAAVYPFFITLVLSFINLLLLWWIKNFSIIKLKFSQNKDTFLFSFDEYSDMKVKYNFRENSDYLYLNLYVKGKTKSLSRTDVIINFPKSISIQKTGNDSTFITVDAKNDHRIKIPLCKILNPNQKKAHYAKRIGLMLQKEDGEFWGETETRIKCENKLAVIEFEHGEIEFNEGEK